MNTIDSLQKPFLDAKLSRRQFIPRADVAVTWPASSDRRPASSNRSSVERAPEIGRSVNPQPTRPGLRARAGSPGRWRVCHSGIS